MKLSSQFNSANSTTQWRLTHPTAFANSLGVVRGVSLAVLLLIGWLDYLTKPINFALLKLRVRNHLAMKEQRDLLVQQKEKLDQMLAERELQNEQLREADKTLREAASSISEIKVIGTAQRLLSVSQLKKFKLLMPRAYPLMPSVLPAVE